MSSSKLDTFLVLSSLSPRFIPDLIAIALSFLDQPEFLAASLVSKDWNRASQFPSASPPIDIDRFIGANRVGDELQFPCSHIRPPLVRWCRLQAGVEAPEASRPIGSSHRFASAVSFVFTRNEHSSDRTYGTYRILADMIARGEMWANVQAIVVESTFAHREGWMSVEPLIRLLSDSLQVLICHTEIFDSVMFPNLRVLKCESVQTKMLAQMHQLESISIATANEEMCDVLHTLCVDHSLREITLDHTIHLQSLPRRLFGGKELPLRHLYVHVSRNDPASFLDCLVLLPSITSICCSNNMMWPLIVKRLSNRSDVELDTELVESRLRQLREMRMVITDQVHLAYVGLAGLRRLDLELIVPNSSVTNPIPCSLSSVFIVLKELEHLSLRYQMDSLFAMDAVRTLTKSCNQLRTLKLFVAKTPVVWCDESIALLSSLPLFERLTILAIFLTDQTQSESQFEISTSMLRSISAAQSFHAIEFQYSGDLVSTWWCTEKTDTQLTRDLDYSALKYFRVYAHCISTLRVSRDLTPRTYCISSPGKKNGMRHWEDQFGQQRTRIVAPSKCSVM